ncbi:hypothetical protein [Micromonospora sp. RTGN7]|uniref:Rv0361 family membrane protein n=1 Tax=Micromonospora sp. RTGN7 TaxID=3016526 RepID=UPI0039B6EF71
MPGGPVPAAPPGGASGPFDVQPGQPPVGGSTQPAPFGGPAQAAPFGGPAQPPPFGSTAQAAPFGASGSPMSGAVAPPAPGYPPYPTPAAPKKKRGLLIASIVVVLALLLCGGGGAAAFFTLRNVESGEGAKEPAEAVDRFLTAVYRERDAKKANSYVCAASQDDKKIAAKVAEVRQYAEQHKNPQFSWPTPKVDEQTGERATVTTKVTMTTADEKVADQDLRFTVVQKTGWRVCEIA